MSAEERKKILQMVQEFLLRSHIEIVPERIRWDVRWTRSIQEQSFSVLQIPPDPMPFASGLWPNPARTPERAVELRIIVNVMRLVLQGKDRFFGPMGLGPMSFWPNPIHARRLNTTDRVFVSSSGTIRLSPLSQLEIMQGFIDGGRSAVRRRRDRTPILEVLRVQLDRRGSDRA